MKLKAEAHQIDIALFGDAPEKCKRHKCRMKEIEPGLLKCGKCMLGNYHNKLSTGTD